MFGREPLHTRVDGWHFDGFAKTLGSTETLPLGYIQPLQLSELHKLHTVHTKGLPIYSETAVDGWQFEISVFVVKCNIQTTKILASTWTFPLTRIHTIKSLAAFISQKNNLVHNSHTLHTKWVSNRFKHSRGFSERHVSAETPVLLNTYNKTLALPFLLLEYKQRKTLQPSSSLTKVVTYKAASNRFIWQKTCRHKLKKPSELLKSITKVWHSKNLSYKYKDNDRDWQFSTRFESCVQLPYLNNLQRSSIFTKLIGVNCFWKCQKSGSVTSYTCANRLSVIPNKDWRRVWTSSSYSES